MNDIIQNTAPCDPEETKLLAFQLWEQANCPNGQSLDFWLMAEQQIKDRRQTSSSSSGQPNSQMLASLPQIHSRPPKSAKPATRARQLVK